MPFGRIRQSGASGRNKQRFELETATPAGAQICLWQNGASIGNGTSASMSLTTTPVNSHLAILYSEEKASSRLT